MKTAREISKNTMKRMREAGYILSHGEIESAVAKEIEAALDEYADAKIEEIASMFDINHPNADANIGGIITMKQAGQFVRALKSTEGKKKEE